MSEGLINGLYIIPILAILIIVHEIGHFAAARAIGAKVEEFGIGLPPRIKGWRRNGVLWSLNWIPFGGFVKVLGDDGKSGDPGSINSKSPAQRALFLVAGSVMNLLLAVFLMVLVVGFQGITQSNVYIASVLSGSPASTAGWKAGDRVVEVAGVTVQSSADFSEHAREFAGKPMSVVVERAGSVQDTSVTPRIDPPAGEGPTGVSIREYVIADAFVEDVSPATAAADAGFLPGDQIMAVGETPVRDAYALQFALNEAGSSMVPVTVVRGEARENLSLSLPEIDPKGELLPQIGMAVTINPTFSRVPITSVIPVGIGQAWEQTGQMLAGIRDLATGAAPLNQIAGPLGMGQITSEIVGASPLPLWVTLSQLAILLSLNLAILNLLPLPALDGGRLLFVIIEVLRGGKKLAPEREGVVHFTGLVLLLGVMVIIFVLDALRIQEGRSFLP